MPARQEKRPSAVMISKRANVFYLEHVRLMQKDERVVYLTEPQNNVQQFVSIPDKNTSFILLGKGTSITDAAARKLAESNVILGFCGSGGSPLFYELDIAFLTPQDEYRPTQYGQAWFKLWSNETSRLEVAKSFLKYRTQTACKWYQKFRPDIKKDIFIKLEETTNTANDTTTLLSMEAHYAKALYSALAQNSKIQFTREPGARKRTTTGERVNSLLDHGNYIAYGYAAVALHGLGIAYFLPVLHGKTRRGALVFDVADLFKDWLVMPLSFEMGIKQTTKDSEFRTKLISIAQHNHILDDAMDFLSTVAKTFI